MRFGRFSDTSGRTFWGLVDLDAGTVRELGVPFASWAATVCNGDDLAGSLSDSTQQLSSVRVLAPYEAPGRVFCCGANYWSHVNNLAKSGQFQSHKPEFPVTFFKTDTSIIGPEEPIRSPSFTNKLDYEIELVAVIGRTYVLGEGDPMASVLGYTIGNDVSARGTPLIFGGPDFFSMKGADRMTPLGPFIVTPDEVGGEGQPALQLKLTVNGETRQDDNTKNMIYSVKEQLEYIAEKNDLRAGDILYTGTPSGPAIELDILERYLQPGDVVELSIEGLGKLRNVVAAKDMPRR